MLLPRHSLKVLVILPYHGQMKPALAGGGSEAGGGSGAGGAVFSTAATAAAMGGGGGAAPGRARTTPPTTRCGEVGVIADLGVVPEDVVGVYGHLRRDGVKRSIGRTGLDDARGLGRRRGFR